jgi:hypothetical protein
MMYLICIFFVCSDEAGNNLLRFYSENVKCGKVHKAKVSNPEESQPETSRKRKEPSSSGVDVEPVPNAPVVTASGRESRKPPLSSVLQSWSLPVSKDAFPKKELPKKEVKGRARADRG